MYRSHYLEAKGKSPDSSLVGCGTLSTGKSDFRQKIICNANAFSIQQWKKLLFLFKAL